MQTIAQRMADYVSNFRFRDIDGESLHRLKHLLLDALGCVFYGVGSDSASITRGYSGEVGGPQESTLLGCDLKTSCLNATLCNGVALRFSEYMDYLHAEVNGSSSMCHPSENVPSALAIAEREGLGGRELLEALFLSCELSGRLCASTGSTNLPAKGWHYSTIGYIVTPLIAGRLLGLNTDQLTSAIGTAGCHSTCAIVDAEGEEYRMARNIAYPLSAHTGIMAAMLAKRGFTGSERVLEGRLGFIDAVLRGDSKLDRFEEPHGPWVLQVRLKSFPAPGAALGIVDAVLNIVKKYDVKARDVKSVVVRSNRRTVSHMGDPVKKYPTDKETADHSGSFLAAVCLLEGSLKPDHFRNKMYSNPKIRELIGKVRFDVAAELDDPALYPAAEVTVNTNEGSAYAHTSLYHLGHPKNPMNDKEVEEKFLEGATRIVGHDNAKGIIKVIHQIEGMEDISELMTMLRPNLSHKE